MHHLIKNHSSAVDQLLFLLNRLSCEFQEQSVVELLSRHFVATCSLLIDLRSHHLSDLVNLAPHNGVVML